MASARLCLRAARPLAALAPMPVSTVAAEGAAAREVFTCAGSAVIQPAMSTPVRLCSTATHHRRGRRLTTGSPAAARARGVAQSRAVACSGIVARAASATAASSAADDTGAAAAAASAAPEQTRSRAPAWLLRAVGHNTGEAKRIRASDAMLRACMEQASQQCLYDALQLPRDFRSEQAMLVLHVWICHTRLKAVFDSGGRQLQEQLFDRAWENATRQLRHEGVMEMSVNKQLRDLQSVSFGAMLSYDTGLEITDDDEQQLGSALWRNVFAGANVPEERVLDLAAYVRREVQRVAEAPIDDFMTGRVAFGPAVGETDDDRIARHERLASGDGEWRRALTEGGAAYYFHTKTMAVQWTPPEGYSGPGTADTSA